MQTNVIFESQKGKGYRVGVKDTCNVSFCQRKHRNEFQVKT